MDDDNGNTQQSNSTWEKGYEDGTNGWTNDQTNKWTNKQMDEQMFEWPKKIKNETEIKKLIQIVLTIIILPLTTKK